MSECEAKHICTINVLTFFFFFLSPYFPPAADLVTMIEVKDKLQTLLQHFQNTLLLLGFFCFFFNHDREIRCQIWSVSMAAANGHQGTWTLIISVFGASASEMRPDGV